MRLTLRTMLCYLDDVLEPADAAELGKKIEESEYASQVVHRIRTSMRRLRLGAPALAAEGMHYDPNTVADYLDNTLPPEQVADFERVCLDPETEVQLAEVAACHQILTLVLGEPAEVPPAMRQRIYDLAHDPAPAKKSTADDHAGANGAAMKPAENAAAEAGAATASAASAAVGSASSAAASEPRRADEAEVSRRERHKPEVPEYLKEGAKRRSWWPALMVLALAAVAIGGVVYIIFNPSRPPVAVVAPEDGDQRADEDEIFDDAAREQPPARETGDATKVADAVTKEPKAPKTTGAAASAGTSTTEEAAPAEDAAGEAAATPGNDDLVAEPGDADNVDQGDAPTGERAEPSREDLSVAGVEPATDPPAGDAATLPPVEKVLGHYTSTGQVLVALDPAAETWNRLASRTGVKPGMRLRALPTYRPQILLDNALQITLAGDGQLIVGNPTDDDTPFVIMPFGRALLATMGKAGNAVAIRAGDRQGKLTMVNADAEAALEVAPFLSPGVDPASEPAHVRVTLTVTTGQVTWQAAVGVEVTLDAGQQLQFIDENAAETTAAGDLPEWIKGSDISYPDRRASATLEPELPESGPIEVKLEELCDRQQVEIRSLAIRSLASLERFERILETLNDEKLRSYWDDHIDQLRTALAHGAPVAAEVRAAAVRASGAEGDNLYRLLWGFSPDQLKEGGAKQLVDLLKHPSLDHRVIASDTLRRITGGRTQGYHPHLPDARRRTAERQWEQSLAAGEVVYATPPISLPPRKLPAIP